jgi:hypothetical protein
MYSLSRTSKASVSRREEGAHSTISSIMACICQRLRKSYYSASLITSAILVLRGSPCGPHHHGGVPRAVPEQMYGLHLRFPRWTGASQLQVPYIRVKTAIGAEATASKCSGLDMGGGNHPDIDRWQAIRIGIRRLCIQRPEAHTLQVAIQYLEQYIRHHSLHGSICKGVATAIPLGWGALSDYLCRSGPSSCRPE